MPSSNNDGKSLPHSPVHKYYWHCGVPAHVLELWGLQAASVNQIRGAAWKRGRNPSDCRYYKSSKSSREMDQPQALRKKPYSLFKEHYELRLRFLIVVCTCLFRRVFGYESWLRIPFYIIAWWSIPLFAPQRLKNTILDDTLMQNNYWIYHSNQGRIPTTSVLRFFSFLIGTSIVYSFFEGLIPCKMLGTSWPAKLH